jgi:hypothetical protein
MVNVHRWIWLVVEEEAAAAADLGPTYPIWRLLPLHEGKLSRFI